MFDMQAGNFLCDTVIEMKCGYLEAYFAKISDLCA